jgi:hypothetical protein
VAARFEPAGDAVSIGVVAVATVVSGGGCDGLLYCDHVLAWSSCWSVRAGSRARALLLGRVLPKVRSKLNLQLIGLRQPD